MAPIIGKAHVAYMPKERVKLSKLAVVEVFQKDYKLKKDLLCKLQILQWNH